MSKYIVTPGDEASTGAIYYWKASGERANADVCAALTVAGVPEKHLPDAPTRAQALRRAVDRASKALPGNFWVRPLARGSFAIVREEKVNGSVVHTVTHHVDQGPNGPVVTTKSPDALSVFTALVETAYAHARVTLITNDIGAWLATFLGEVCMGTLIREDGGVWFVPPTADTAAREAGLALNGFANIQRIPAMRADDALKAIVNGLTEETGRVCEEIETWIAEANASIEAGDKVKGIDRSKVIRNKRIDEIKSKLDLYRKAIGANVSALVDTMDKLRSRLITVAHASDAAAEGRTGERMLDLGETSAAVEPEATIDLEGMRGPLELD